MATALVTGAGRGIGRAIVHRLAKDGFDLIAVDVDQMSAQLVADEVGGRAECCDVTDEAAVTALAAAVPELTTLVNNAGIFPPSRLVKVEVNTFRKVFDVNVVGPFLFSRAFLPQLQASGGAVVNIASMAAKVPTVGTGAYSPSKAALVSLTKLCAIELAPVRFNAIGPGGVVTEGTAAVMTDPEREARTNALMPLGRRAYPEDIADAVSFFASTDSRYVTGQVLYVDGGITEATVEFLRAAQSR